MLAFRLIGGTGKGGKGRWIQPPLVRTWMPVDRRDLPKRLKQGKSSYSLKGFNTPTSILRLGSRSSKAKMTRARRKVA